MHFIKQYTNATLRQPVSSNLFLHNNLLSYDLLYEYFTNFLPFVKVVLPARHPRRTFDFRHVPWAISVACRALERLAYSIPVLSRALQPLCWVSCLLSFFLPSLRWASRPPRCCRPERLTGLHATEGVVTRSPRVPPANRRPTASVTEWWTLPSAVFIGISWLFSLTLTILRSRADRPVITMPTACHYAEGREGIRMSFLRWHCK